MSFLPGAIVLTTLFALLFLFFVCRLVGPDFVDWCRQRADAIRAMMAARGGGAAAGTGGEANSAAAGQGAKPSFISDSLLYAKARRSHDNLPPAELPSERRTSETL